MKKIVLALSLVTLCFVSHAQDDKSKSSHNKETKSETVVNPDGTTSTVEKKSTAEHSKTRMAITEKGTAGTKSTPKKEASKESEKNESQSSPVTKPH